MTYTWKNIKYTTQKLKVERHIKRGFGANSSPIKEVVYDEDEDDGTPCILVIFWSARAFSFVEELEQARYNIEADRGSGLEQFRIDIMASCYEESRRCLVERASR